MCKRIQRYSLQLVSLPGVAGTGAKRRFTNLFDESEAFESDWFQQMFTILDVKRQGLSIKDKYKWELRELLRSHC